MPPRGSRRWATRRACRSTARWCGRVSPGLAVGKLQAKLDIAASTLSHHLKTLVTVDLVTQERQTTTLICRANYPVMRGLVEYLVDECCAEAACPPASSKTRVA